MSVQYNKELDGSLDLIKDNITKAERSLTNTKIFHPKVMAIYQYLQTWHQQTLCPNLDSKTLVVIFRGFEHTSQNLIHQLEQLRGLNVVAIGRKSLVSSMKNTHVFVCDPTNIPDNFPWSSFVFIIAFEDKLKLLNKVLLGKCTQVKRFICLRGVTSTDQQELPECNIEGTLIKIRQ